MKMWRRLSIDQHLRTMVFRSSSPRYSSMALALNRQLSRANPCPVAPISFHYLSFTKTLDFQRNVISLILKHRIRSFSSNRMGLVIVRCLSSTPSTRTVDWNGPVSCSEADDGYDSNGNKAEMRPSISVRAYFLSTSVDLRSLVDQNKANFIPPASRMTNYVVLRFGGTKLDANGSEASLSGSSCCYMVVFQYGSMVLFNVCDRYVDAYLKIVERHALGLLPEMLRDEYEAREKPTLNTWMQGGLDYIMLQYLNIDGIRIIGSVLGQSIALDYYVRQVDGIVAEFTDINRGMEKTGTFTMGERKLFQLVGKANSNLADVILKLGLFERLLQIRYRLERC